MKNLSIRAKILLGFLVVVLIAVIMGAFSLMELGNVTKETKEITGKWLPGVKIVSAIQNNFSVFRAREYKYILARTIEEAKSIENEIGSNKKEIANGSVEYQKLIVSPDEQKLFESFQTDYNEYVKINVEIFNLYSNNKKDEAMDLMLGKSIDLYYSVSKTLQKIVEFNKNGSETGTLHVEKAQASANIMILAIIALSVVISIIIAIYIAGIISKGVGKMQAAAEKIAIGDMDVDIEVNSRDEIGKLALSFANLVKTMKSIAESAKLISNGDLTVNITKRSEKDELLEALAGMVKRLNEIVGQIVESSNNVAISSGEMSSTATQLSQGANEQASSAEEISSSIEEMNTTIQQNSDNATQTEKIALASSQGIDEVFQASKLSLDAIKQIVEKIKVINSIAEKTDILAINAAIEAARAGDHGKGFAVVAAEVRKLAETSQKAAVEINQLSAGSLKITEDTSTLMAKIIPDIQRTAQLVQEIAASSLEQSSGADQIAKAIEQLSQVTQQNSAAAEEMSSSSEELASQAELLKDTISFFKTENNAANVSHSEFKEFKHKTLLNHQPVSKSKKSKGADIMIENDNHDQGFEHY